MSLFLSAEGFSVPCVYVAVAVHMRTREWMRTKVGYSIEPGARIATIASQERAKGQRAQFYEMLHYLEHPSALAVEKATHRFLDEFSLGQEWFDCPPEYAWLHVQRIATEHR